MTDFYASVLLPALPYLRHGALVLGGLLLVLCLWWVLAPFIALWRLDVPARDKRRAAVSFAIAWPVEMFCLLWGFTAFIAVPLALRRWQPGDTELRGKWMQRLYGNNVGLYGDNWDWTELPDGTGLPIPAPETDERAIARNYWLPGTHPNTKEAVRAWLLRNRSSLLGVYLGRRWTEAEHRLVGGEADIGEKREGWRLTASGNVYQLQRVKRMGGRIFKQSWGHKVGLVRDGSYFNAPAVYRSIGFGRWKGPNEHE